MHPYKAVSLAVTLSLIAAFIAPSAFSAPGQINSTNEGRNIVGGTYNNTASSKTTFKNSAGGGLWLKSGVTIRGFETDTAGIRTGNGGAILLDAPGNVVRLDGKIDISALKNGSGVFIGNGGNLTVNSAYIYQTGAIYANGNNGGNVTFNVGSATFNGSQSRIEAIGVNGNGGVIRINGTPGVVDIHPGTVFDSRGKVIGNYDTNVISVNGGMVHNEGLMNANGILAGQNGGKIELVANAHTDVTQPLAAIDIANNTPGLTPMFDSTETSAIKGQQNYYQSMHDGHVHQYGTLKASGADGLVNGVAADGGFIHIDSEGGHFHNSGLIRANGGYGGTTGKGGNGGTIDAYSKWWHIENEPSGIIEAKGGNGLYGGNGGSITLNADHHITNNGIISADGGSGRYGGNGGRVTLNAGNYIEYFHPATANGGTGTVTPGQNGFVNLTGTSNIILAPPPTTTSSGM